jgi:hypothetical protein
MVRPPPFAGVKKPTVPSEIVFPLIVIATDETQKPFGFSQGAGVGIWGSENVILSNPAVRV